METVNVLFHKVPFVRLAIFFALGCLALVKGVNFIYAYIVLISAALFLLLHFLISKQEDESQFMFRWFYGASVSAFMFAFGMIFSYNTQPSKVDTESRYFVGCVKESNVSLHSVKCTVALSEVDECRVQKSDVPFDAVVFLPKTISSEKLSVGDSLMISPKVVAPKENNEELGFDESFSNTFFVQDDAWTLISKSHSIHALSVRDTLISQLKKKDVQMLN